jgi:protein-tyrosine phosphatase
MKVLMVCLGNICRSPLAEAIFRQEIKARGLDWEVDSAGTSGWHQGELPDTRSIEVARRFGLDITDQRSRQFTKDDLKDFDFIFAMDHANLAFMLELAGQENVHAHIARFLEFAETKGKQDVPDPYWDDNGFTAVFQLLEEATGRVIDRILAISTSNAVLSLQEAHSSH